MGKIKYSKEVVDYIIENHKGKTLVELANMVNKKFNMNINNKNLGNLKNRLRVRKGIILEPAVNDGRYRIGQVPANKGKKWDEYLTKEQQERCRITCYKKGNIPANHRKIGEERTTTDGYIEVKVKDGCLNDNWELKHRYIYKQHYGKIPAGYNVIFLDGNKQNTDISNLKLVSKYDDLIMNRNKLFTKDKELTETGTIIANVISETYKKGTMKK